MATAAPGLWDLTGKADKPTYLPTGSKTTESTGAGSENSVTNQVQQGFKAVNTQNTPGFALQALQELITSLQDRPAISDAELDKQAPELQQTYKQEYGGWVLIDPKTARIYRLNDPEAIKAQATRKAERQALIQSAGITPGGTAETRRSSAERATEISRNREQQGKYSKEMAFADASKLNARFARQLLEQLMPSITKAVEASGTSGGAVQGLLSQDAAARVAESQAALGLNTAVQYGQISNQLAGTLELLTRENSPTTQALLQALSLAKGTINQGTESSTTTGQSVTNTTKATTQTEDSLQVGKEEQRQGTGPGAPIVSTGTTQPSGPSYMSITKTDYNDTLAKLVEQERDRPYTARIEDFEF